MSVSTQQEMRHTFDSSYNHDAPMKCDAFFLVPENKSEIAESEPTAGGGG